VLQSWLLETDGGDIDFVGPQTSLFKAKRYGVGGMDVRSVLQANKSLFFGEGDQNPVDQYACGSVQRKRMGYTEDVHTDSALPKKPSYTKVSEYRNVRSERTTASLNGRWICCYNLEMRHCGDITRSEAAYRGRPGSPEYRHLSSAYVSIVCDAIVEPLRCSL
jgi:hypothetical protein